MNVRIGNVGKLTDRESLGETLFQTIDGDHSYEGVIREVAAWMPHLRSRGLALFHDTGLEGVSRGVAASKHLIRPTRERKAWSIRVYWKG